MRKEESEADVSVFDTLEYAIEEAEFLADRDAKPYALLARECCYVVKPRQKVTEGEIVLETFIPKYN